MAKSNFSKAEEALNEFLIKRDQQKLWKEAGKDAENASGELSGEESISMLQKELKKLYKKDSSVYDKVSVDKKELKNLLENVKNLTPKDWVEIQKMRERVKQYKDDLKAQLPHLSNEELVEQQTKKHINKRFNVKDTWLPLT